MPHKIEICICGYLGEILFNLMKKTDPNFNEDGSLLLKCILLRHRKLTKFHL